MSAGVGNERVGTEAALGNPPPRPDLSNFAEHLRLVHLTLILACLIAVVAATSQSRSSAGRAYDQASQLLFIQKQWKAGEWLENALIEQQRVTIQKIGISEDKKKDLIEWFKNSNERRSVVIRAEYTLRDKPVYLIMNIRPLWRLTTGVSKDTSVDSVGRSLVPSSRLFQDDVSDDQWEAEIPKFENLESAKLVWDSLEQFGNLIFPKNFEISDTSGWAIRGNGEPALLKQYPQILAEDLAAQAIPITVRMQPLLLPRAEVIEVLSNSKLWPDELAKQYETAYRLLKNDDASCYLIARDFRLLILRVNCIGESVSLQSQLTKDLIPHPPFGDFARSFPDLDELSKNLSSLRIGDLRAVFLAERNRSGEKIEVWGAKLPNETAMNWSIVIILAVVAYLYVIYRDFARRVAPNDKAWDVPWIGGSSEIASQTAFLVTIAIVPATIAFVSWKNLSAENCLANGLYGAAVAMAIALSGGVIASRRAAIQVQQAAPQTAAL